jgi:Zn finger protein HypA/HybF involved in hydrogenase expression
MSEQVGFRCRDCDNGFVINLLSEREAEERRRLQLPVGPVRCPQCQSIRVERIRRAA